MEKIFLVIITTKIAAKELFGSCAKRIMSIMTMRAYMNESVQSVQKEKKSQNGSCH